MKTFRAYFAYEFKRFFCRKNTVVFLIFLILSLYFVRDGISQYKHIIENKDRFQEIEKVKVTHYINYTQYGLYGFRLMFIPSPLSVFFTNSSLITELTANIDSADVLKIYNSFKGKNLYADKVGGYKDFAGIILLFGSLLVLYFGYDSFQRRDYMKFLSSISGYKQVFAYIQVSRLLLLMGYLLVVSGLALFMLTLNGLILNQIEFSNLLNYLLVLFLLVIFLFLMGAAAGTIRSRFSGIAAVIVIWFAFVFFIPGTVFQLVSKRADDMTSNYHLELEKMKVVMAFEKKALDEAKRYPNMEERKKSERQLVESYWNNEFKKLQAFEKEMHREMMDNFQYFRRLSILFPSTFYLSVSNEISSRGYENYFSFYEYIQKLKAGFVRYYFNKKFYSNYDQVESFIKGNENLFSAKSQLPGNFNAGVALTFMYILLLAGGSYLRFKSFLFYVPDKQMPQLRKLNVELKTGRSEVVLTGEGTLKNQFYNVLSGEPKEFDGKLMLDETDIAAKNNTTDKNFLFLCRPEKIPEDIKAGQLIRLFQDLQNLSRKERARIYVRLNMDTFENKTFSELDEFEKGIVLWTAAQLNESSVYLLDDFAKGMPADFIIYMIDGLRQIKEKGSAIIYLTTDTMIVKKVGDSVSSLFDDPNLHKHLKTYRYLKDENSDQIPINEQDRVGS
jgi:ABC-type Na+ transport system ATPase subunit NatA